ncbi:MAG: thiamine diphosphokinase [Acidimicrobiia bacterium]|nr:thiamine diphosphokinase [Acidimicrobiia bacterium]NNC75312.1 thiamine diphosphokinase [Acidimicrobiia bacterium]
MENDRWAIILAGGDAVRPELVHRLPADAYVVAADSGLAQARSLGIPVDVVIGDFDSADPADVAEARAAGAKIHEFPVDKDATDLELALRHAVDAGYERMILIGGTGGRFDHFLANALVLASAEFAPHDIEWIVGDSRLMVVRRHVDIHGSPGDFVSLLAVGGPVLGVATEGLKWTLQGATLATGSTRGVSNELTADHAVVELEAGTLLVIHTLRNGT